MISRASTTTVTRVAKFLENGEGGYRKVLNAHRHHRMVSSSGEQTSSEIVSGSEVKKPTISVLQKYLEKAKEQG